MDKSPAYLRHIGCVIPCVMSNNMVSFCITHKPSPMRRNSPRPFNRLFLGATAPLILLALSHPVSARDMNTSRHSLIHRPPSQSSPPTKPESSPSRSRPSTQSASPATPSLPLHHKLTKKATVLSSALPPTTSIAATGSPQHSRPPSPSGSPPVEAAPATQAKPLVDTPAKPIAPAPIVSSLLGVAVPSARTASAAQSMAAASSGAASTQLPGSMQRLLQANPSFASLLQAPTPVVSTPSPAPPTSPPPTPSSTPPPSTPPSPPATPTSGSATLTWAANGEPDLAGYKVYVGTASGTYNFSGSPFTVGNVTTYTVPNLPRNNTYFFAISAYDSTGNESPLSFEVSKSIF